MPSVSPRGLAMRRAQGAPVSRAQLLLQYLLALEVGVAERETATASVKRGQESGTGQSSRAIGATL